jgi:hypothetical protein
MPRRLFVLALFVLLVPGRPVLAGPPEGPSGEMVLDEVADGLRKYHKEKDTERRIDRLLELAPMSDPRVLVTLGEALGDPSMEIRSLAVVLLASRDRHDDRVWPYTPERREAVMAWWKENEAELRRRAKQLPQ